MTDAAQPKKANPAKAILDYLTQHPQETSQAVDAAEQAFGSGSGEQKAETAVGIVAATASTVMPQYAGYAALFQLLAGTVIKGVVAHKNATKTMPVVAPTSAAVNQTPATS